VESKIIVIGGMPCAGKTTLSKEVSKELKLPVVSKDEIEAAVARKGLASSKEMNGVGYEVMRSLAKGFIESGCAAIFDFTAAKSRVEQCWPELFELNIKYIECVCSNEKVHKERAESRFRDIEGWYELSWSEILEIQSNYEPLRPERLVLDSANELRTNVKDAIEYISE
jgi:predicted kinase